MSDLVKRLRMPIDPDDPNLWVIDKDRLEAADRIEALEAALREIMKHSYDAVMVELARAALVPEQKGKTNEKDQA